MCSAVCRVCLVGGDVRLHCIEDTRLLDIYEKLADTKFVEGDGRPDTMCYVCYRQLQRCRTFSDNAHRAESILTDLLYSGSPMITHDAISTLNLALPRNLCASAVHHLSIEDSSSDDATAEQYSLSSCTGNCQVYYDDGKCDTPFVAVKEERVAVKEEIFIETAGSVENDVETSDFKTKPSKGSRDHKTNSESLKVPCEQCNRKFKNARYLKAHMITHSGQKPFSCDACGASFGRLASLRLHARAHSEAERFACARCDKTFLRQGNLSRHLRTHAQERSHGCDSCGKRFKQRSHLAVHARIHTGERAFACEMCGKTFNQIANLNKHLGIHRGAKPFSCAACGKAFLQRAQLAAHARTHSGEKPYACGAPACRAAFSHAAPLRRHRLLHAQPAAPYPCDSCALSFLTASRLAAHARAHAPRPHECAACRRTFADARGARRHLAQVHRAERLHKCARCGKRFKRPQHLRKHATSSHCRPAAPAAPAADAAAPSSANTCMMPL